MGDVVAKVIEFYMPDIFRKKGNWRVCNERGKVIEFPSLTKKSA
jgi:hypothetical protein